MLKIYTLLFTVFISLMSFGQSSESFTNIPPASSTYTNVNWTGDNNLPWTSIQARTDTVGSSVNGMTGRFLIFRFNNPTMGSIICDNIPGGCSNISFKYARAFGNNSVLAVFINNVQIGADITVSETVATSISLPVINAPSNFKLELRVISGNRVAIDDIVWTPISVNAPCNEPTAQPEDLNLNVEPTTITGDFTPVPSNPDAYLVVRSTSPTLSGNPVDGTSYTVGQSLGGGTVRAITTVNYFTDANLAPNTQYYYFIYAFNYEDCSGGPNYVNTNPLTSGALTPPIPSCVTPSGLPSGLTTTATNTSISGNFSGATGANRYLVVISTNSTIGATPVNGTTYTSGQSFGNGTVVSYSSNLNFIAANLLQNTQYFIYIYAVAGECTGQPQYNSTAYSSSASTSNISTGIPVGFYNSANGLTCQPLKTALKNISKSGYVNIGYDGVYQAYIKTDIHRNDANTADVIYDIYSDNPSGPESYYYTFGTNACGEYKKEGDCYNREHSTPKSWFNDASPMYSDIQHLYPTDGWVNGKRSNFPYGEVTNTSYTSISNKSKLGTGNNFGYTGTVFEPNDAFKGDLARTSFYMVTRYEDEAISQNWSGNTEASPLFLTVQEQPDAAKRRLQVYDDWYIKLLFKWIGQDPVSQKEIDRNNAIYYLSGQNNRNPFVDHPEYAAMIWQCTGLLPVTITDFTATKFNEVVNLKWFATFETSFKKYEIERSIDGVTYNKIGEVAGQNFSNYSYTDNQLPNASVLYYRLKMIDIDGQFSYSKIAAVKINNQFSNAVVYPNPTTDYLNIKLTQALQSNSTLMVTDVAGRNVIQQVVSLGSANLQLDVKRLPAGRYFLKIYNNKQVINQAFVVIK